MKESSNTEGVQGNYDNEIERKKNEGKEERGSL